MVQEVSIIAAFLAGFLSFLAPCILPLIPSYFSWILGISKKDDLNRKTIRRKIFLNGLFLVLGFSVIFIALGASASFIGQILSSYRLAIQRVGGLIIVFFGLQFIGILKVFGNHHYNLIKKLFSKINFALNRTHSGLGHKTSSFFVGLVFAFAWVACFGPILGSILVLASFQGTLIQGIILLAFYSLGLAIPFLLTSLFLGFLIDKIKFFTKITKWINLVSGTILIILGILLFTDNFYKIVIWFSKVLQ